MRAVIPTKLCDEELASIEAPTLILTGEHEKIFDPSASCDFSRSPSPRHALTRAR